jgi:transcriptional accessory protein Tex/SPT6
MKKKIPTHDPHTGELNPHYEELTGKKNPMTDSLEPNKTDSDRLKELNEDLKYWKQRKKTELEFMEMHGTEEFTMEIMRVNRNLQEINAMIASYNPERVGNKVFLIDIDGTVSEDIKNEDNHLYATAAVLPGARDILNKWYYEGNTITFFTAREEKDRAVTEKWLKDNGFKYHRLVMDKPRIKDGQEYVWIDNRKVRAVTYLGTWGELKEVDAKIQTF